MFVPGVLVVLLCLVTSSAAAPQTVLVLGSGGLVGRALTAELVSRRFTVKEVVNRLDVDLRYEEPKFEEKIDFAFFLACEVGGSKYLTSEAAQSKITLYNQRMYDMVFPYLERNNISFIFSSSMLATQPTSYGRVKKAGEDTVIRGNVGKIVRFYNVYGWERIGLKSHVISDWISSCIRSGQVFSATDGLEKRQFSHADDVAEGLVQMMLNFNDLPPLSELTTGHWTNLRTVASHLERVLPSCVFHFGEGTSTLSQGPEPSSIFRIESPLHLRLKSLVRIYTDDAVLRTSPPFLSIVMVTSNDHYNGIQQRTLFSLASIAANANASNLHFELIIVQYNPRLSSFQTRDDDTFKHDIPLSKMLLWNGTNIRIITVPPEYHRWPEKGAFWEYVGKNIGAAAARGRFIMFVNPDGVLPRALFDQLSKQQLSDNRIYRAWIMQAFVADTDISSTLESCETLSSVARFCVPRGESIDKSPLMCHLPPDDVSNIVGGRELHLNLYQIGDFSIYSRELFLASGGYFEMPQNQHIETAHVQYSTKRFNLENRFLDAIVCHQEHSREGRPAAHVHYDDIAQAMERRALFDGFQTGTPVTLLPEAVLTDPQRSAYNPEHPFRLFRHHELFAHWEDVTWTGAFNASELRDFVGTRTSYTYDCADKARYRFYHLSRRIPCARQDHLVSLDVQHLTVSGDYPIVDEEYFEWLALLRAIVSLNGPPSRPFVVMEYGARYGTWVVRGVNAFRRLYPESAVQLLAVEADATGYTWLQQHLSDNGFSSSARALRGFVADTKKTVDFGAWEEGSPPSDTVTTFTVDELLSSYQIVDIIHVDIQGSESCFLQQHILDIVSKKVRYLHFGTHSDSLHADLVNKFSANGWNVLENMAHNGGTPPGRVDATPFGDVRILWDGVLTLQNGHL